jgi:hypothetical protein
MWWIVLGFWVGYLVAWLAVSAVGQRMAETEKQIIADYREAGADQELVDAVLFFSETQPKAKREFIGKKLSAYTDLAYEYQFGNDLRRKRIRPHLLSAESVLRSYLPLATMSKQ